MGISAAKRRNPLRSTSKGEVQGRRSQACRPYRSPPEGTPKTYSTPLLPTTQDGVPKHAPADKQGGSRQDQRTGRYAAARGQVLLHRRLHFHSLLLPTSLGERRLLGDGGRHKDYHSHQGYHGQVKYPLHDSLPPSLFLKPFPARPTPMLPNGTVPIVELDVTLVL